MKGGPLERKYHLVNWDTACLSKENGELGLGKFLLLNKAFLGK